MGASLFGLPRVGEDRLLRTLLLTILLLLPEILAYLLVGETVVVRRGGWWWSRCWAMSEGGFAMEARRFAAEPAPRL